MKTFWEKLGLHGHAITWVDNAAKAIKAMEDMEFDVVFLDHDLGGETYVDTSNENTGSEVVRWMTSTDVLLQRPLIVLHSMNQPAAEYMESKLIASDRFDEVHRIPFTQLVSRYFDDPGFLA